LCPKMDNSIWNKKQSSFETFKSRYHRKLDGSCITCCGSCTHVLFYTCHSHCFTSLKHCNLIQALVCM
jgi:hypothetical protein